LTISYTITTMKVQMIFITNGTRRNDKINKETVDDDNILYNMIPSPSWSFRFFYLRRRNGNRNATIKTDNKK
jgi:hypothetical protein